MLYEDRETAGAGASRKSSASVNEKEKFPLYDMKNLIIL